MAETVVLHHDDLDGRCAAACVRHLKDPSARCFAVEYGRPLPVDQLSKDTTLYVVDFTPETAEQFNSLINKTQDVVWIDHHGENIKKYPELDAALPGKRVESKPSGALLTWDFLANGRPAPRAVLLTSDFDTWTHSDPDSIAWNTGAHTENDALAPTNTKWDHLLNGHSLAKHFIDEIIDRGRLILKYNDVRYDNLLNNYAFQVAWEGYRCLALNSSDKGSLQFKQKINDFDLCLTFCYDGKNWRIGLYSTNPAIHCGKLAKQHGGGGHPGAAGFQCDKLPFNRS